jgi:hypothetical protein
MLEVKLKQKENKIVEIIVGIGLLIKLNKIYI